ncbi:DNA primase, partial [Streptococcus agalactiae]|nr:DNA primase [Streptococcus agalactiae]
MGYFCGGHDLAIDKEKISEIKNSVNIVDVIGEVVGLTKTGRNHLGLCPFHKEKTPSFNVIEDRQFFHCFGCGRSGDVFKFVEDYQHISFLDSVQVLAERSGIPLDTNFKGQVPKKPKANQSLLDIHRVASGFYHAYLMTTNDGERARQYLAERGVTEDLIKHFQIGLSPGGQDFLYRRLAKEFDEKTLMSSGLFNYSENSNQFYDSF